MLNKHQNVEIFLLEKYCIKIYFPTIDLNIVVGMKTANGQSKNTALSKYPV